MTSVLAAVVLAGGESRRFGADKLSADLDGETLLERVVSALPHEAVVYVVGPIRPLGRPVTWLREEPAGGALGAGGVFGGPCVGADWLTGWLAGAPSSGSIAVVSG